MRNNQANQKEVTHCRSTRSFSTMSPVATRAKRKESPLHHPSGPKISVERLVNPKKRRLGINPKGPSWQLSSDILHQVLGFFVSNGGVVDVDTLKSAMLVSKQWHEVTRSPSFWSSTHELSEYSDPIRNALYLMRDDVDYLQQEEEVPCFIGFSKIAQLPSGFGDDSLVFRAVERSSRRQCLLCVSPKNQRTDALLNHLFEAHFFQGSFGCMTPQRKSAMRFKEYPLGVGMWGGRVIRWYEDIDSTSISTIPPPVFCPKVSGMPLTVSDDEPAGGALRARSCLKLHYRHLQFLELSQNDSVSHHLSTRSWAMIVDWLIEITMCFCLDSRIPFHAMELLRRFISRVEGVVSREKYQLLASACMQIATKCNMGNMKAADFRYCSDNLFTVQELCDAEAMVLNMLQWQLAQPTIIDYLYALSEHSDIGHDKREATMIEYLADLALQSQVHMDLPASKIAACITILARYCLAIPENPLWNDDYMALTGYLFDDLCDGTVILSRRLDEVRTVAPNLRVIDRRHRQNIAIPLIATSSVLKAYQSRMTREVGTS